MKKRFTLLTALMLTMALVIGSAVVSVDAASASYDAPSSAACYVANWDSAGNTVWEYSEADTYNYNSKGNLVSIGKVKSKWKYKGKKASKVTTGSKKTGGRSVATYKKGKLKTIKYTLYKRSGKRAGSATETFKYNKKGWISRINGKKGTKYTAKYSYKYHKNGLPKSITEKFTAYGSTMKATAYFDQSGLVTTLSTKNEKNTFKYEKDASGRVTSKTIYLDGDPMYKIVYSYNGSKANKKTYFGVMNLGLIAGDAAGGAVRDVIPAAFPMLAK